MLAPGIPLVTGAMVGTGAGLITGALAIGIALVPGARLGGDIDGQGATIDPDEAGGIDAAGDGLWLIAVAAPASTMLAARRAIDRDRGRFMASSLGRSDHAPDHLAIVGMRPIGGAPAAAQDLTSS